MTWSSMLIRIMSSVCIASSLSGLTGASPGRAALSPPRYRQAGARASSAQTRRVGDGYDAEDRQTSASRSASCRVLERNGEWSASISNREPAFAAILRWPSGLMTRSSVQTMYVLGTVRQATVVLGGGIRLAMDIVRKRDVAQVATLRVAPVVENRRRRLRIGVDPFPIVHESIGHVEGAVIRRTLGVQHGGGDVDEVGGRAVAGAPLRPR